MLNELWQALDPVAFSLGPLVVRWYSLAYIAGFALVALVTWRLSRRWGIPLDGDEVYVVVMACVLGVIVGGRLGYCLFYGDGHYLAHPLDMLKVYEGGMSFHGGFAGCLLAGWVACRRLGLEFLTMADMVVCGVPAGLFFGRLANFVNGELWGKPTDVAWAVCFDSGGGVPRHPSQLYEALLEGLVLLCVLLWLARRVPPLPQGSYLGVFFLLYGTFRFLVEFVRLPDAQLGYLLGTGWLTMGQVLSVPLVLVGVALLAFAARTRRPQRLRP